MTLAEAQVRDFNPDSLRNQAIVVRHLKVANRALTQLAASVVRGDPTRSLVELITNSDDSYRRLECANEASYGRMVVTLDERAKCMTVLDYAEGMGAERMDTCVGTYGDEVSGFSKGMQVRGFYGRGLKEAILGLGSGSVKSIRGGSYNECYLNEDGLYTRQRSRSATVSDYLGLGIPFGRSGTKIFLLPTKIKRFPRFEWVKYSLSNHTTLRDIMQSARRRVICTDGERCEILSYSPPNGRLVLRRTAIPIPGFEATLNLTVYESERPLSQEGYTRDGGLLIKSSGAIHGATLFRFDYNPYASRLFGEVRCNHIDELMSKGELVVSDKRDGLDLHHPFTRALKSVVEAELQPLVEQSMVLHGEETRFLSKELKRRFDAVLWEINRLAMRLMKRAARYGRPQSSENKTGRGSPSPNGSKRTAARHQEDLTDEPPPMMLFRGIRLNPYQDPRIRVYLDKTTGFINIATRAPSVAMYYGKHEKSREFLTLVSELVGDTVCSELATMISNNNGSDDVQEIHSSLKNRYAHLIHRTMRSDIEKGQ